MSDDVETQGLNHEEFPKLYHFLSCKFGQFEVSNWHEYGGGPEATLETCCEEWSLDYLAPLRAEIDLVLSRYANVDDESFRNVLASLGSAFYCPACGWTFRGWLTHVGEAIEEALQQRAGEEAAEEQ